MSITQRVEKIVQDFAQLAGWEERYKQLIQMGKALPPMDEELKIEANKVKGCQSQVWLHARLEDGKVIFEADSDAAIAKGIVALLLFVYSDAGVDEIISTRPDFIDKIGLKQHLSMNRTNGMASMLKQIQMYALAFKAKMQMEAGQ